MKIALPTKGNMIDDHFGQCENYTVFTIDENDEIAGIESIPSLTGCGCKSGIAALLQERGVEIMLAGNMGDGALNVLKAHGIAVFRGCSGDITEVTRAFLRGEMKDSGESCRQHHGGDDHGQHHGGGDHGQHHGSGGHGQGHGGGGQGQSHGGGDHGQHHGGGGHGQSHGGGGHGQRGNN
jgi:predicted Fe-Mo cluster-binding NifX family protein